MEDLHQMMSAASQPYSANGEGSSSLRPHPNVNPSEAKAHKTFKRILIDSRNRDTAAYYYANDFVQTLPNPIRAVRSITLTDARIPLIANPSAYFYSVVCLPDLSGEDLICPKESSQFTSGALAVIPMIPATSGDTHAYYASETGQRGGGCAGGWRLEFPMGITISRIRVQILTFNTAGTSILLPIPYGTALANNLYLTLEIEHDI